MRFQFDGKVNLLLDLVAFFAQDDDRSLCRSPNDEVAVIFGAKLHTNDAEVDFMGTKAAELVPVERRATAGCGRIANIHQRKGRAEKERIWFGDHDAATRIRYQRTSFDAILRQQRLLDPIRGRIAR